MLWPGTEGLCGVEEACAVRRQVLYRALWLQDKWLQVRSEMMSSSKGYPENRARPNAIRLMTDDREKKALARAAKKAGVPLSTFVREAALREARG
jgi:hypothetical protein